MAFTVPRVSTMGLSSLTDRVSSFTQQLAGEATQVVGDTLNVANDTAAPYIEPTQEIATTVAGGVQSSQGNVLSGVPFIGGGVSSFQILALGAVAIAAILLLRK